MWTSSVPTAPTCVKPTTACTVEPAWFVDSRATTLHHIGEFVRPLAEGTITEDAVLGDLHELVAGRVGRETDTEITVFKNGGELISTSWSPSRW